MPDPEVSICAQGRCEQLEKEVDWVKCERDEAQRAAEASAVRMKELEIAGYTSHRPYTCMMNVNAGAQGRCKQLEKEVDRVKSERD